MIQKTSLLCPADKSGVLSVFTFHLYKGFNRRFSYFGDYVKVSVRDVMPDVRLVKKTKKKSLIVRTKKSIKTYDGAYITYCSNNLVILKKRLTPESSSLTGPIVHSLKKKKFMNSFMGII